MHLADIIASSDTPAVVGAFVTIIVAFLGIAKIMLSSATKEREADRKERKELSDAIKDMAESNSQIAVEMKDGNRKAEIRNGHLGEQNVQIAQLIKESKNDIVELVQNVKTQHVDEQTVAKTIVTKE